MLYHCFLLNSFLCEGKDPHLVVCHKESHAFQNMAFLPCKSFPSSLPQNCTHNSGPIHSLFTSLFFLFDYTEIIRFCVKDHRVKVPFSLYDIKGPYNQRYLWYLMLSHLGEGVFVRCLLCTVTLFSPLSTLYSLEGCPIQNWHLRNKKNRVHCAFDWSIYIIHFELFCMRDSITLFINL